MFFYGMCSDTDMYSELVEYDKRLFFPLTVVEKLYYYIHLFSISIFPREDAGGVSREYVLRIPSVS